MTWKRPLADMPIIPRGDHPGAFAAVRKHDVHTGVDLYAPDGTDIYAVEDGVVQAVVDFTGENAGSPWWENTEAILIRGASGVVLYGEVFPLVEVGERIRAGEFIGFVKRVLKVDKGRPMSMLHLELYEDGTVTDGAVWKLGDPTPAGLLDPTELLGEC